MCYCPLLSSYKLAAVSGWGLVHCPALDLGGGAAGGECVHHACASGARARTPAATACTAKQPHGSPARYFSGT
jgi:hypothetical protein